MGPRVVASALAVSCLLLASASLASAATAAEDTELAPVVNVEQGKVAGSTMLSRRGKRFFAYLGIPYAEPPLWDLRFQVAQKPDNWDDVFNATKEGSPCPQLNAEGKYIGNEDCLYINIFTHLVPDDGDVNDIIRVMRDVIVVIHDGGFTTGSGSLSRFSPEHLMDHNVVLVTFNYRLGPLGFLAAGDMSLPGNVGLKDQSMALRWVLRNGPMFGGNPHSVTLLGVEAGAASAHYHMFTHLSFRKFARSVSLSGTALSPWAHVSTAEARRRAFRLGELVECPPEQLQDGQGLRQCLSKKRAKYLVRKAAKVLDGFGRPAWPFVPVTEPFLGRNISFVPQPVTDMVQALGRRKLQDQLPWLIGTTSHEGLQQALAILDSPELTSQLNEDPGKFLPKYLGMVIEGGEDRATAIGHRIWDFYMQGAALDQSTVGRLVDMIGDYQTLYGVSQSIELHTNHTETPMFVYNFGWKPKDSKELGVPRGSDVRLLFPEVSGGSRKTYTEEEYKQVDRLVQFVVNFARESDPTYEEFEELEDIMWIDALYSNFSYMHLTEKMVVVDGGLYPERMQFWESILGDIRREEDAAEKEEKEKQQKAWREREEEEERLKKAENKTEEEVDPKKLRVEL
ncbi:venom carboxylesterase-6-like [Schistocerca gregaria]|uniref:venom carboxylesterase-6-like n=1 Tax=Schistocerca gregaria TaxID=7010 RepID=UPI00211ECA3D|nr:venom carboxylesterase-6-like [Schistocerca gregaria]